MCLALVSSEEVITSGHVSSLLFCCIVLIKTLLAKSNLRWEGLFGLCSITERSEARNSRQKLVGRDWAKTFYWLSGLSFLM